MAFEEQYEFRDLLTRALCRDLMGPSEPEDEEVIEDAPVVRYITGLLFPRTDETLVAQDGDDVVDEEDGEQAGHNDPPVALAHVRFPSSMGVTLAVDSAATTTLRVHVTAARYETLEGDEGEEAGLAASRRRTSVSHHWRRRPLSASIPVDVGKEQDSSFPLAEGLSLYARTRPRDGNGVISVTLALVNELALPPGSIEKDASTFFQPELRVSAENGQGAFVERPRVRPPSDEDLESHALLYRHLPEFAVGHGCSATWELDGDDPRRAGVIRTTFIPTFELLLAESNPAIELDVLGMRHLAETDPALVLDGLRTLCGGYEHWITEHRDRINTLPHDLQATGDRHLRECEEALARMRRGVEHLASDTTSWSAFRLANAAMTEVRARTVWLSNGKLGSRDLDAPRWRPFQLAFMLLCLEGLGDPRSTDRALADLLWFPTGGGKTEAYLGLIAFTILRRRLSLGDNGAGISVLMRYTLRLLTTQQFERATLLICALEQLRRERGDLGSTPIAIGLWIGRDGTPNTLSDARTALQKLRSGSVVDQGNPVQVRACPWCGKALTHYDYYITDGVPRRLVIRCGEPDCDFQHELPVSVVDDDIYTRKPSLVIATADKFAGLPWREQSAAMFNRDGRLPPPELIIQDELHLISGPLGTLAGHYETAIDLLCTNDGVRPKVIASTATIRRATEQSLKLFAREVRQFPPPGLDARDSYFAVETSRERKGTRQYLGVMAPATSQTSLLVRVYASLLQRCAELSGSPEAKDPYWTVLGYFNSLRVLGGARMQIHDDVVDRIKLLAEEEGTARREIDVDIELTSRIDSGSIPAYLRQMQVRYPDEDAIDVILATNMISVGVDIDRLGLMAVMGQPQSTSEYIQATSRIGRRYPGLVVTMYNAARSRDRSHYESFVPYHSALYRQVESTSVTPFSARARDRALHALVVTLARLTVPGLQANDAASRIADHVGDIEGVKTIILERVAAVEPTETERTALEIDEVMEHWMERATEEPALRYRDSRDPTRALLHDAAPGTVDEMGGFPTLWSLRDVDTTSGLYRVM